MELPATDVNSFDPSLNYIDVRPRIKLDGQCLKQYKITFTHKNIVNIYMVYEIHLWPDTKDGDFRFGSSLFGAVKFTKNADFDKTNITYMSLDLMQAEVFVM